MKEELVNIFIKVAHMLKNNSQITKRSRYATLIKGAYKCLGKHIKKYINYDIFALQFNQGFYCKNFLKNLIFLDYIYDNGYVFANSVMDIGCGAAPASTALNMLIREKYGKNINLQVDLLDKSFRQLELAKGICSGLSIDINSYQKITFRLDGHQYNSLAMFSYFVCEQEKSFIKSLYKYRNCFKSGFIIVDYKYVIERIKKTFDRYGDNRIHVVSLHITLPPNISDVLQEKDINVYGCYFENR